MLRMTCAVAGCGKLKFTTTSGLQDDKAISSLRKLRKI